MGSVDSHASGARFLAPEVTRAAAIQSEGGRSLSTVPEELDVTIGAPEDQT